MGDWTVDGNLTINNTTTPSEPLLTTNEVLESIGVGAAPQTARTLELASNWQLDPGKGIVGYKPTFIAKKALNAVGWYTFLKFGINSDGGVRANRSFTVDIVINRVYQNGNNETHSVRLLAAYDAFTFTSEESRTNGHYITQIRYARNGNDGYLQLYYNTTNNNTVQVDCVVSRVDGIDDFSAVQLEQADNYTAFVTKTFNAQCFPVFTTRTDGWISAVKSINATPTEQAAFIPFTMSAGASFGGLTIPSYTKGVFVSNGADAAILGVDSGRNIYSAFRNNTTWTAAKFQATKYVDKSATVSFAAGTIGTRGFQTSWTSSTIGGTPIATQIISLSASNEYLPMAFIDGTTAYLNAYRAVSTAVSNRNVTVRITYV